MFICCHFLGMDLVQELTILREIVKDTQKELYELRLKVAVLELDMRRKKTSMMDLSVSEQPLLKSNIQPIKSSVTKFFSKFK